MKNFTDLSLINRSNFIKHCQDNYNYQKENVEIYRNWLISLNILELKPQFLTDFHFLPIQFFKSNTIIPKICKNLNEILMFESSGTSTMANKSRHYVIQPEIYHQSLLTSFIQFVGEPQSYNILALLPSYLDNKNSSLIYMVQKLMEISKQTKSGFYKNDYSSCFNLIKDLTKTNSKILLFTVTFALLDFLNEYSLDFPNLTIINTGGTKGRSIEFGLDQLNDYIKQRLPSVEFYQEYGMTELLSQGYSQNSAFYRCPSWMKVMVSEIDQPLSVKELGKGRLLIIDLANYYSCSFIATEDYGEVLEDGSFIVYGRIENSDIRGCSQLVL